MEPQNNKETTKSAAALKEEELLEFWRENKVFEKSLEKESPKGEYVFYDGPPFATGTPHYGHILGSTAKDVLGRYKTMQGYHVPRRWGWDCHGLPIENIVEKDLKISGRKAIEEYGIGNFTEYARSKVLTYVNEWKKTIDRMGRWVDFDNSYKTMDNSFIESVWWALGELNKKGLIYEGVRTLAYCPRCETPIANSEIAMDNSYKDITDISVTAKFELVDEPGTFVLAWTTTAWTLPGNAALAVNPEIQYIVVRSSEPGAREDEQYIVAKDRAEAVFKNGFKAIKELKAGDLVGRKYKPLFNYYSELKDLKDKENGWKIYAADFVTVTDGTGVVHIAPAFGEDDNKLGNKEHLPFIQHVTANGKFKDEVTDFAGLPVKPKEDHQSADVMVIKYLAGKGTLFAKEKFTHSYPHCYRCETPLYYYALPSWFVNIQKEKEHILKRAEEMTWIPAHLKDGRFRLSVEGAPDWTISRNRYWATPLPFWKSKSGKLMTVNSLEDLKSKTKKSGNKYYVMRHGQAENNISPVPLIVEEQKCTLTETGRSQVIEKAKSFHEKIDVIIASPLNRTKETAEIICKEIGFPIEKIIYDDRLREWEISTIFEGKDRAQFLQYYVHDYRNNPTEALSDGESFSQVIKRVGEFIYDIEAKYSGKKILLVSHDGVGRAMRFVAKGASLGDLVRDEELNRTLVNAEINELKFVQLPHNKNYELDYHRPYIDDIKLVDENGEEYTRITEVIDCWFESGSMPFAQDHYPFENKDWQKNNFPAGFVAEYVAQTRTWFYYTHAISTILFDHAPFKNVVTTGTVLAEDGQKMSKSKGNFPDPWLIFDRYSVDALRIYLMMNPLMKGEDLNFSEKGVDEVYKKILMRLTNVLSFYKMYAGTEDGRLKIEDGKTKNVLDAWILARLNQVGDEMTKGYESYELDKATRPMLDFVDDLSTWYTRRSRDRFKSDNKENREAAIATTRYVLMTMAKLMAPVAPFVAEHIYRELRADNEPMSVHLCEWPEDRSSELVVRSSIIQEMQEVRKVVALALEARAAANIKIRQPLSELVVRSPELEGKTELLELIKDEVNVKSVSFDKNLETEVKLDTVLTDELKQEGELRELVRAVQDLRKTSGLTPDQYITLTLPEAQKDLAQKFEAELKKSVKAKNVIFASEMGIEVD